MMRLWTARQWTAAALGTVGTLLLLGIPSVLLPNDLFVRQIEAEWWVYPVWVATSVLCGLLLATYTRPDGGRRAAGAPGKAPQGGRGAEEGTPGEGPLNPPAPGEAPEEDGDRSTPRKSLAGGLLAWFAIGCPTCNVLVLAALGTSGALNWFAPVQPVLAVVGLALLSWALRARLRGAAACRVGAGAPGGGDRAAR